MKGNTAQVKGKYCTDPNKPLYPAIELDSDFWFAWLKESDVRSFHYESETGKFTARKEERATSTNEYWYAYRKIAGKLRKVYLGAMEELTGDRLEQVAQEISQPGWEFYSSRKSYPIKKEKSCVTTLTAEQSYPIKSQSSCVTDDFVEALQAEIMQLRSQTEKATQDETDREQEIKDLKRDLEETQLELQKTRSLLKEAEGENNFQETRWKLTQRMNNEMGEEIKKMRSEATHFKAQPIASRETIKLLEAAITPKNKGGNYSPNNATGLRSAVEQALKQLKRDPRDQS